MLIALTRGFLLPGDIIADLLGANQKDDRGMIRTLINMLFWNVVGATFAVAFI